MSTTAQAHLPWLNTGQALVRLYKFHRIGLASEELLQFCEAGDCSVYLDCTGRSGRLISEPIGGASEEAATGFGCSRVVSFRSLKRPGPIRVYGEAEGCKSGLVEGEWWLDREGADFTLLFKREDIDMLAAKISVKPTPLVYTNDAQERAAHDLERLRQHLEQERAARQAAERRAEQAEAEDEGLRQQLCNAKSAYEALRRQERTTQESPPEIPATGLTFPYATKHLEAMRDAALEYWQQHDRSKPAPYGIQKEVQKFLAGRTGENARKLAELAAAIKPDDLPKS